MTNNHYRVFFMARKHQAGREWTEMPLYKPDKFDEYFSMPSSGKLFKIVSIIIHISNFQHLILEKPLQELGFLQ